MACFIIPAAEAVITAAAAKALESRERNAAPRSDGACSETMEGVSFSRKLKWLRNLLWGGSGLLAFEHVWHGEIVPFAPFLTAASDPAGVLEMLREMAAVGAGMAALVTAVWAGMVAVSSAMEKSTLGAPGVRR